MNEREDYLDRLLRGVEEKPEETGGEEDFFSSFGSSVSEDGENDFLKAFEESMSQSKDTAGTSQNSDMDFDMDDIDHIVSNVKNGTLDDLDAYGSLDDGNDLSIDESLKNYTEEDTRLDEIGTEYENDSQEFMVNTLDGNGETEYEPGGANQELLDMLSGIEEESVQQDSSPSENFSLSEEDALSEDSGTMDDPGTMDNLTYAEEAEMAGEPDSAAESLAKELESLGLEGMEGMEGLESLGLEGTEGLEGIEELEILGEEADGTEEKKKGKKDKKNRKKDSGEEDEEKPGFFRRLSLLLFGEDDEVEEESVSGEGEEGKDAAAEEEKARKKQEKKEQKKKEKAEKKAQKEKEKQEKPKKEKKPKAPRVVEKSKPLPKGPVVLIMLVGLSLVILINLISSQIGYTNSISQAKEYYEQGDYVEAYSCFNQGSKVKQADEELYNKARLTAYVQQQINSYKVYQKQDMYQEALSALICGVGRYDKNANEAAASGAAVEYDKMLAKLKKALKKNYGMTLKQARELYAIRDKEEFTLALDKVIEELGLE